LQLSHNSNVDKPIQKSWYADVHKGKNAGQAAQMLRRDGAAGTRIRAILSGIVPPLKRYHPKPRWPPPQRRAVTRNGREQG
jgi:hypothetical protein